MIRSSEGSGAGGFGAAGRQLETSAEIHFRRAVASVSKRKGRIVRAVVEDKIVLSDHFMAVVRDVVGKFKAFRESSDAGRAASADLEQDLVDFSFVGSPPQNEEDTMVTCRTLVIALRLRGEEWYDPRPGKDEVDCEAVGPTAESNLEVQVVRALPEKEFWREVGIEGRVKRLRVPPDFLAEALKRSIEKKTVHRPIPPAQRSSLTLALDARRTPALAFDQVVEAFRVRYGEWATAHGFAGIWIVGPTPETCSRLDASG